MTTAVEQVEVVDLTGAMPNPADVPEGWTLLEAGITRQIRVNRHHLIYPGSHPCPWIVTEGRRESVVLEVRVLGAVEFRATPGEPGCHGTPGRVWVETDGPVLVRRAD